MYAMLMSLVLCVGVEPSVEIPLPNPVMEILPSDMVLASMILSAPAGALESDFSKEVWVAMKEIAIREEWIDSRETTWLDAHPVIQFRVDYLRGRRDEMLDCPKSTEINRFPTRAQIEPRLIFNREFNKKMLFAFTWESDRQDFLRLVLKENEELYNIWSACSDARSEFTYVPYRREALRKMKKLMGEDKFVLGEMPDYVPSWRFYEGKK